MMNLNTLACCLAVAGLAVAATPLTAQTGEFVAPVPGPYPVGMMPFPISEAPAPMAAPAPAPAATAPVNRGYAPPMPYWMQPPVRPANVAPTAGATAPRAPTGTQQQQQRPQPTYIPGWNWSQVPPGGPAAAPAQGQTNGRAPAAQQAPARRAPAVAPGYYPGYGGPAPYPGGYPAQAPWGAQGYPPMGAVVPWGNNWNNNPGGYGYGYGVQQGRPAPTMQPGQ